MMQGDGLYYLDYTGAQMLMLPTLNTLNRRRTDQTMKIMANKTTRRSRHRQILLSVGVRGDGGVSPVSVAELLPCLLRRLCLPGDWGSNAHRT